MYTKTTISGIDLHWNYQKHFWFIYIKELLVQKYWQLISTKQLWSVRNIVSSKSRTVQYRVQRCPGQYRNVQDRVPRCPGPEMSRIRNFTGHDWTTMTALPSELCQIENLQTNCSKRFLHMYVLVQQIHGNLLSLDKFSEHCLRTYTEHKVRAELD